MITLICYLFTLWLHSASVACVQAALCGYLYASICSLYWLFKGSIFTILSLILLQPSTYTLMFTVTFNLYFNLILYPLMQRFPCWILSSVLPCVLIIPRTSQLCQVHLRSEICECLVLWDFTCNLRFWLVLRPCGLRFVSG